MLFNKKLLYILCILIFGTNIVFSACLSEPTSITVTSGGNVLGPFTNGDLVYILPDLNTAPLKIEFTFENTQDSCFTNENDMTIKLFPTGSEVNADTLTTSQQSGKFISKFAVTYNIDFEITSSFTTTYSVQSQGNSEFVGTVNFEIDNNAPNIDSINILPTNKLVKKGDQITIDYTVSDFKSGLKSVGITGGTVFSKTFTNGETSFSQTYQDDPTSTKTYYLSISDNLGHIKLINTTFVVDAAGPTISNLNQTYSFINGKQYVTFTTRLTDESFSITTDIPSIVGDFSQINPSFNSLSGSCSRNSDNTYTCSFSSIEIKLGSTSNVNLIFTTSDSVGNVKSTTKTVEVRYDKDAPKILESGIINSNGVQNIVSPTDFNTSVKLKFQDESIKTNGAITITENFGSITAPEPQCTFIQDIGNCEWKLGSLVNNLNGKKNETFQILLTDHFSNSKLVTIQFKIDNKPPVLNDLKLVETESIKDGIIKSGERIEFQAIITDDNLFSNNYFVYGDFGDIDFRTGKEKVQGACTPFNQSATSCRFIDIVVENGYMKRNVTFNISDAAGNKIIVPYEVEIFKISDETFSSYRIRDVNTINPINRNILLKTSVKAWFESDLELQGSSDIKIINYQIQGCNESSLDPFIIVKYGMFPDDIIINNGQANIEDFAIFVELRQHGNINDMGGLVQLNCKMSVLKRDNTQIYPAELVDFNLYFKFYDMPREDLIKAHATTILQKIDETKFVGDWFDTVYDTYYIFKNICSVVSEGTGTLNSVENILLEARLLMDLKGNAIKYTGYGELILQESDQVGKQSTITSELNKAGPYKAVQAFCGMVTCQLDKTIVGALGGFTDITELPRLGEIVKFQQDFTKNVCTFNLKS